jgi:hypothetical protein
MEVVQSVRFVDYLLIFSLLQVSNRHCGGKSMSGGYAFQKELEPLARMSDNIVRCFAKHGGSVDTIK